MDAAEDFVDGFVGVEDVEDAVGAVADAGVAVDVGDGVELHTHHWALVLATFFDLPGCTSGDVCCESVLLCYFFFDDGQIWS